MIEPNYQPDWSLEDELTLDPAENDELAKYRRAYVQALQDYIQTYKTNLEKMRIER